MRNESQKKGFILVYTVLILAIMVIISGIFIEAVLKEVSISRDESESLKAFYAADSAIECARYYHAKYDAFDTMKPEATYNCGVGASFKAGGDPATSSGNPASRSGTTAQCVSDTRTFTINGFSNGSCAIVTVNISPRRITVDGSPYDVCDVEVISNGRNRCGSGTSKLVERARWETI